MTQRQRKYWLWTANAAMGIAIAAAVSAAFWPLEEVPAPRVKAASRPAGRSAGTEQKSLSLDQYTDGFSRNLRMPLFDAAPASRQIHSTPAASQPALHLTGTVVEQGNSFAIFRLPGNEERLVGLGEKVEDALVVAVTGNSATVKVGGRTMVILMENADGTTPNASSSSQGMPDVIIGRGGRPLITGRMARRTMQTTMPVSQPAEGGVQ